MEDKEAKVGEDVVREVPEIAAPSATPTKRKAAKKVATKKAKAKKKAPAKKTGTKKASGAKRERMTGDMKITVIDAERAGKMHESRRAESFKLIKAGMSVDKYLEKGGDRTDLSIMKKLGIVKVA